MYFIIDIEHETINIVAQYQKVMKVKSNFQRAKEKLFVDAINQVNLYFIITFQQTITVSELTITIIEKKIMENYTFKKILTKEELKELIKEMKLSDLIFQHVRSNC